MCIVGWISLLYAHGDSKKSTAKKHDQLNLNHINHIRALIRLYHDETLPVRLREKAFIKFNELLKQYSR